MEKRKVSLTSSIIRGLIVAVGFLIVALALLDSPQIENRSWLLLPSVLVPLAGGLGGMLFYYTRKVRQPESAISLFATIMSIIGYLLLIFVALTVSFDSFSAH